MKITAQTTDEQIIATITDAKQALLDFVTEQVDSEYLQGERMVALAQNVVSAEAVATVALRYMDFLRNDGTDMQKMTYLMGVLTRGADDTWSGRTGDSKRLAHDAVKSFVEKQFDVIRYGA